MMKEHIKNQIVDIDGYIHVINGKVICFKPDVYDLHNLKHVGELFYLSLRMSSDDEDDKFYYSGYGNNTILFLDRNPDNPVELTETMGSLRYMPEDVQKKCKLAILKQKNQIIDVDGYIHVVSGRVICFKSDVYDLHNPNDVADLVLTSFEIGVDDKFPLVHGNDTILFLDKSPTVANELIVSMGDLRGFPKDVQKKCKLVISK